jgi:hypothetical protein
MGITPEYGEEELLGRDEEGVQRRSRPSLPDRDLGESEVHEREIEASERTYVDFEDNELRAPGEVCERCGAVITATQDVRRLPDGRFVHEVCPTRSGV